MTINAEIIAAIMGFLGIGVISIITTLKTLLKLQGIAVNILAALVSIGATAAYLFQAHEFSVLALVVYSFVVFGEATGLYQWQKKKRNK